MGVGRSVVKTYTLPALNAWVVALEGGWEGFFSKGALEHGRRLYKNGSVLREISVTKKTLTVESRTRETHGYSIVELDAKNAFSVRSSFTEVSFGQSLAVAGIYELEALIVDLSEELATPPPPPVKAERPPEKPKITTVPPKSAPVLLLVQLEPCGLTIIPAPEAKLDREAMIALFKKASSESFEYDAAKKHFFIKDPGPIAVFAQKYKKAWSDRFLLQWEPSARGLLKGKVQARACVSLEESSKEDARAGIRLHWGLNANGKELPFAAVKQLLRAPEYTLVVPDWGIVSMNPKDLPTVRSLQALSAQAVLPPYLLFSINAQKEHLIFKTSKTLKAFLKKATQSPPLPKTLPDWLRGYQKEGVAWMRHLEHLGCHGLLADEMGLGKTLQVLYALDILEPAHHLVVCPASVIAVWEQELKTHFFKKTYQIVDRKVLLDTSGPPCIWLCSYTQLRQHRAQLSQAQFTYAILDEAQNIKNPEAKTTQACMSIDAQHRLALTGTPLENRPLDVWTLFRFLMPGFLPARKPFEAQLEDPEFLKSIEKQWSPFILRRTKEAVAKELPKKQQLVLNCPLTPLQQAIYRKFTQATLDEFGDDWQKGMKNSQRWSFLAQLCRLRQICCDPSLIVPSIPEGHSAKVQILIDSLESLFLGGHKVVVFSQYTRFLDRIEAALKKTFPNTPRLLLIGKTQNRAEVVSSFQSAPGAAIILVSLRAGGTGISLHAADYLFLMDPWWNPALESQAIDRIHRIGQTQPVMIYRLISPGTIEDRVQALQLHKAHLAEQLLSSAPAAFSSLEHVKSLKSLL